MLTNKVKLPEPDAADLTEIHMPNEPEASSMEKRPNNLLLLERPKHNTGKLRLHQNIRPATNDGKPESSTGTESTEIKLRIEAVLERMKTRAATADTNDSAAGEAAVSEFPEELERRRAAIIAIAREAEIHSREAADKFRQAENKLKEETEHRLLAEQRLAQLQQEFRQIEEESRQWFDTAQTEETKRVEAEKAKAEVELRLKQETEARVLAEQAKAEAEAKSEAAAKALESVNQALVEAESKVRTAEEAARTAESLIYEADAIARQAEEKCRATESNLQREAELRALAEQMLKELASVSPHLELNWENLEAALSQAGSPLPPARTLENEEGALLQLREQIEAEQKTRIAIEQMRADAESKVQELEAKLRKAEEKYRTTENGYKKVLRKQEEELRAMSEQVVRNNDSSQSLPAANSETEEMFLDLAGPSPTAKIKFVSYGVLITLLALALVWLGISTYHQL